MAFKREGNDGSWLNHLKNRRVAELFAEDIPEGEAHLMKNGRFACLVCAHRPIFDTVLMLARHREGKKHAANVEEKLEEEEELRQLRTTRQHEEWTRTGQIPASLLEAEPNHAGGNTKALLGAAAYDPRCRKHKRHPNYRKPAIDLDDQRPPEIVPSSIEASDLPGNRHPRKDPNGTPNVARDDSWKSYKCASNESKASQGAGKHKRHNPINPVTGKKMYDDGNSRKRIRSKPAETIADHRKMQAVIAREEHMVANIRPYQRKFPKTANAKSPSSSNSAKVAEGVTDLKSSSSDVKQSCPEFIQGYSFGYIKDKSGSWVKDQNAEFDSDDDST